MKSHRTRGRARAGRPVLLAAAFFLAAALPADAATDEAIVKGELGKQIDEYLTRLAGVGFSGATSVVHGGEVVLRKGYGFADREAAVPVNAGTVFTVGSITKQFTGAAVLKLQMQGKLSVRDPISKYFDGVPEDKQGITIHHLLTHSAGLPDGFGYDFDTKATDEWVLGEALGCELLWEPGTRYRYSNVGFSLAGMIVERVSGQGYEEFLREQLFEPAGMRHTGYFLPEFAPETLAVGYREGQRWGTILEKDMLDDGPCWNLRGNGGIHSTVADMIRWHEALLGDEILSAAAKAEYFAPHVNENGPSDYGYGWSIVTTRRGTTLIEHNGGNPYFSADFKRYVDEDAAVFLASNQREFVADRVTETIDSILFGGPYPSPPATITLRPRDFERFAGTYELPAGGGVVEVSGEADRLRLVATGDAADLLAGAGSAGGQLEGRTKEVAMGFAEGDVTMLHSAMGGEMSVERLEAMHSQIQADWDERLGAFRTLGNVGTTSGAQGSRSFAELRFERGSEYVVFGWEGGQIADVALEDMPPWKVGSAANVFPLSETLFESYDMRAPASFRVEFELDADGAPRALVVLGADAQIRAERIR